MSALYQALLYTIIFLNLPPFYIRFWLLILVSYVFFNIRPPFINFFINRYCFSVLKKWLVRLMKLKLKKRTFQSRFLVVLTVSNLLVIKEL